MNAEELVDRTNLFWQATQSMDQEEVLRWLELDQECAIAIALIWERAAKDFGLRWTNLPKIEHFFKGWQMGYAAAILEAEK